jgi:hypothetical protein
MIVFKFADLFIEAHMKMLKDVYGAYNIVKFWVIVIAISGFSAICLPAGLNEVTSSAAKGDALWISVFLIGLTAFGIFIFPFALWQHIARKRFFNWLESQWSNLEAGATHPAGYTITYDTPLVRYEVVFSVILATVSFTSRPYVLNHPTTKIVRVSYTLFSLIFGWWFLAGFDGVVGTLKALAGNINQKSFTIKQLLSQTNTSLPMK